MIKPEQIPDEVKAILIAAGDSGEPWNVADVIAAMLNAWEGAGIHRQPEWEKLSGIPGADVLCLPLPQEPRT